MVVPTVRGMANTGQEKPDGPCVSRGLEVESTMKFNDYGIARDAGRKLTLAGGLG